MCELRSRDLDQEPDTIVVVPAFPAFVVIGTYSLVPKPEGEEGEGSDNSSGGRIGSLQLLPFSSRTPDLEPITDISFGREDFAFGIYDIHFHPRFESLLGVATSDGEILFFDVLLQDSYSGKPHHMGFSGLGRVVVEEPDSDDGSRAIITSFHFLDIPEQSPASSNSDHYTVFLAATTQLGNTELVQAVIPRDTKHGRDLRIVEGQTIDIHRQTMDLEAWTALPLFTSSSTLHILSGGDDSQLLVSSIEAPFEEYIKTRNLYLDLHEPTKRLTEKRTHEAGIVHICNLGPHPVHLAQAVQPNHDIEPAQYLVLTGSYDENLRLFLFSPANPNRSMTMLNLLSELNLGGGVWRIILLDTYDAASHQSRDYILLIAAHTAGACIVRLSCTQAEGDTWKYEFKVEKWFTEGHESLVYAVAAKKAVPPGEAVSTWDNKTWDIISTSFYDKKVCDWQWVDEKK